MIFLRQCLRKNKPVFSLRQCPSITHYDHNTLLVYSNNRSYNHTKNNFMNDIISSSEEETEEETTDIPSKVIISVAQLTSTSNLQHNFDTIEQLVHDSAKNHQSRMLFLPECFAFMGESAQQTIEHAETLDGPLFTRYRSLAKQHQIAISFGGFHEKHPSDATKIFNSHVLVDSRGEIRSLYRKLHLFDVDLPHKRFKMMESAITAPGSNIMTCGDIEECTPLVFGVSICFDIRFPELYLLMRNQGANCLLAPSAFTRHTGHMGHWHTLLKARAIENQSFVVAAAQVGRHNAKRESYGHSLVVDPWGQVICDMDQASPSVQRVELDMQLLDSARESIPLNKRGDIYSLMYHHRPL